MKPKPDALRALAIQKSTQVATNSRSRTSSHRKRKYSESSSSSSSTSSISTNETEKRAKYKKLEKKKCSHQLNHQHVNRMTTQMTPCNMYRLRVMKVRHFLKISARMTRIPWT